MIAKLRGLEPVQQLGIWLLALSFVIALAGAVDQYSGQPLGYVIERLFRDFYANVSAELGSIAITVLIIDSMVRRRARENEERREKNRMLRQVCDPDNAMAIRAVEELRSNNWLEDGSLENVRLTRANLAHAHMEKADLRGAHLWLANLRKAWLCEADMKGAFVQAANLQEASLDGANLAGVNLNEANLLNACLDEQTAFDSQTILPDCTYWTPGTDMCRFTDAMHPEFWRSTNPYSPAYRAESGDD